MTKFIVRHDSGQTAIGMMRFFAWISLISGIVAALLVWLQFGSVTIPGRFVDHVMINWVGVMVGFGILFQGVFVGVVLFVVAYMAESLGALSMHLVEGSTGARLGMQENHNDKVSPVTPEAVYPRAAPGRSESLSSDLMQAAKEGDESECRRLLEQGADPSYSSSGVFTAREIARRYGHHHIVDLFDRHTGEGAD
jgi:hypothetical protein